jgi:hypothetical protein
MKGGCSIWMSGGEPVNEWEKQWNEWHMDEWGSLRMSGRSSGMSGGVYGRVGSVG